MLLKENRTFIFDKTVYFKNKIERYIKHSLKQIKNKHSNKRSIKIL